MYFTYEKGSLAALYPLKAHEVKEIMAMNRRGEKPATIKTELESSEPEFITSVGDDSISRFDEKKSSKKKKSHGNRHKNSQKKKEASKQQEDKQ